MIFQGRSVAGDRGVCQVGRVAFRLENSLTRMLHEKTCVLSTRLL